MGKYIIRLDDASEYMDVEKWKRIEELLKTYDIKPIVGIIPDNQDIDLVEKYEKNELFWNKVKEWQDYGWTMALHGCTHQFSTACGGINPVNKRSEFAGLELEVQKAKISKGNAILKSHDINAEIFFAPAHTFDENTLKALETETDIRVISDTIANDVYYKKPFYFVPQQSGSVRKLPFNLVTFCYHPNNMQKKDFDELEAFIKNNKKQFIEYGKVIWKERNFGIIDSLYKFLYFARRN